MSENVSIQSSCDCVFKFTAAQLKESLRPIKIPGTPGIVNPATCIKGARSDDRKNKSGKLNKESLSQAKSALSDFDISSDIVQAWLPQDNCAGGGKVLIKLYKGLVRESYFFCQPICLNVGLSKSYLSEPEDLDSEPEIVNNDNNEETE